MFVQKEDTMTKLKWLVLALGALSLFVIGCEREITGDVATGSNASDDCLACHSGSLDQAQGEWANSVHAAGAEVDYTNRGGTSCNQCHDQQGFIEFWETGDLPDDPFSTVSAIGCFTCHDPHENGDLTVRFSDPVTLENGEIFDHDNGNICVMCHHARRDASTYVTAGVEPSSHWGPHHSNQGDLIEGTNGWEFPGEDYTWTSSPHASQVEDACAGCHMGNPIRSHEGYKIGGHSFNMADEEEGVNLGRVCGEGSTCHTGVTDINFVGTDSTDWDGDGTAEGYQDEIDGLMDSLEVLLVAANVWDGTEEEPVGDAIADVNLAGALYNFIYIHEDRSHGIHNFKYAKDLIEHSIHYVDNMP
jgi:hypothetical protein